MGRFFHEFLMDRQAFTTGQLVPNAQLLGMEKAKLVGLGYALEAIMGSGGTVVSGLACTPTPTPSLSVVVGRGSIMTTAAIDASAYSDLGTDTNATIKQGILQEPGVTLTLTPPSTPGYSQVYLIQAKQSDNDTLTTVPFYNASNPAQPYNGPNNSNNATLTARQSQCVVSLVPGAAATSGSQVAPAPQTGNVGLYTITLTNGQSQITAAQIVPLPSAPFVPVTLPGIPLGVQSGAWTYAVDTGSTAGALVAALSPIPGSLPDGFELTLKATRAAAGGDTLNLNGFGALPILRRAGATPKANDWTASDALILVKQGSTWQLAGLVPSDTLTTVSAAQIGIQNPLAAVTTPGTYTYTPSSPKVRAILVRGQAAGGGGAGATSTGSSFMSAGCSGGGGGYFEHYVVISNAATYSATYTVGAPGTAGAAGGQAGGNGGSTSFGGTAVATGGQGGFAGGSVPTGSYTVTATNAGGTASGGSNLNRPGGGSSTGLYLNSTPSVGAAGGSQLGNSDLPYSTAHAGTQGNGYGAGGTGGCSPPNSSAVQGGLGGSGLIQITEFF